MRLWDAGTLPIDERRGIAGRNCTVLSTTINYLQNKQNI